VALLGIGRILQLCKTRHNPKQWNVALAALLGVVEKSLLKETAFKSKQCHTRARRLFCSRNHIPILR